MREQVASLTCPLRRQPLQHIFEIGIRIMPISARRLDQIHDRSGPLAAAKRPGEQPVRAVISRACRSISYNPPIECSACSANAVTPLGETNELAINTRLTPIKVTTAMIFDDREPELHLTEEPDGQHVQGEQRQ